MKKGPTRKRDHVAGEEWQGGLNSKTPRAMNMGNVGPAMNRKTDSSDVNGSSERRRDLWERGTTKKGRTMNKGKKGASLGIRKSRPSIY